MKVLTAIGTFLELVLFIFTWRIKAKEEQKATMKQLEVEADEAIRSGDLAKQLDILNRVRQL